MNRMFIGRRLNIFVLIVFLVLSSLCFAQFAGGEGTQVNPYQVSNPAQLNQIRLYPGAHFLQIADIDLNTDPYNGGAGWSPVGTLAIPFSGSFDGNGYAIHNLYLSRPGTHYQALFGFANSARLHAVKLITVNISGGDYAGALLGLGSNCSISNCSATGFVQGASNVGALIGALETNSSLFESFAICHVSGQSNIGGLLGYLKFSSSVTSCYAGGIVSGNTAIGGLLGTQGASTIQSCYAFASVSGNSSVGGLVGVNDYNANIIHSYACGSVSGSSNTGGLVGRRVLGNVSDSYWDIQHTSQSSSAGGSGLTTQAMVLSSSYPTWLWDFDSPWQIVEGYSYPYLIWQGEAADFNYPEGLLLANDLGISDIEGQHNAYLLYPSTYTVQVTNHGSLLQNTYTIKFYREDDTELQSVEGIPLSSGESQSYQYTWIPENLGEYAIYAKVILSGDENNSNDQSPLFTISVHDAIFVDSFFRFTSSMGTYNQIVGTAIPSIHVDDAISGIIPLGFSFPYGDSFYNEVRISSNGWIGLGTDFTSNYLSNVLNSTTVCPVIAPLWDDIGLQTGSAQYLLSGIAPNRIFTVQYTDVKWRYTASNQFSFQALMHESGRIDFIYGPANGVPLTPSASIGLNMLPGGEDWFYSITPGDPPTISKTVENNNITSFPAWGTTYTFIPNYHVYNDLAIMDFSGEQNISVGMESSFEISIHNYGTNPQSAWTLQLIDQNELVLASIEGDYIEALGNQTMQIFWTPSEIGSFNVSARIVFPDDENPVNNQSDPLNVWVLPFGVNTFTVGSGNLQDRIPFNVYYKSSLYETIYQPLDISAGSTIYALGFYNNFISDLSDKATKIWLGNSTLEDLSTAWIPASELSLVFDGNVDYPAGENLIPIYLDSPFVYEGGNLLMMVLRPLDVDYYASTDMFYVQSGNPNISREYRSDTLVINPDAPPVASAINALFPKTSFIYSSPTILESPTNLRIEYTAGDDFLQLNWDAPASGSPDLYLVYRDSEILALVDNTQYQDTNLLHRHSYTYTVVARYGTLDSDPSAAISQTVFLRSLWSDVIAPVDLATDVSTIPQFMWDQLRDGIHPEPDGYVFELFDADGVTPIYSFDMGYTFSFLPPEPLAPETQYTWQVLPYINMSIRRNSAQDAKNQRLPDEDYLYGLGSVLWTFSTMAYLPPSNFVATEEGDNVHLQWTAPGSSYSFFEDNFEAYPDFALQFAPWTLLDIDQSETWGITGVDWENTYSPMAYIIFNPSATTPPLLSSAEAHSGTKYAASFDASITPPNNDWMISPLVAGGGEIKFWARSFVDIYGLERFKIGVSTTGTAPNDFTIISGASYIQAPVEWTEYTFSLAAYAGQNIHVGIQCVSYDAFIFMVDDVIINTPERGRALARAYNSKNRISPKPEKEHNYQRQIGSPRFVNNNSIANAQTNRMDIGYKLWRFESGQESNESTWVALNPDAISTLEFTDYSWQSLEDAYYNWAVKAVFPADVYSSAAISNPLQKYTALPQIVVSPTSLDLTINSTETGELYLNITNMGDANLEWSGIIEEIIRNLNPSSIAVEKQNLRVNIDRNLSLLLQPIQGVVAPGDTAMIRIQVESVETAIDQYNYQINISSNDPLNPYLSIPLNINIISPVAYIPDANFRMAINDHLGQDTSYQPTIADLNGMVGTLVASSRDIISIEGAQHLTNMPDIRLNGNQISDISPLIGMNELQRLELNNNQINDIVTLAELTNLQRIDLESNQISDISPIANLTNLQRIYLGSNLITDISHLAGVSNLQLLNLKGNQISDLSPLSNLTNLQYLYLWDNQISDISTLSGLTNLQYLYLWNNQISNISPLASLSSLQELVLDDNQIMDISPLTGMSELQRLELNNNQISDISPLAGLTNLDYLELGNNPLSHESMLLTQTWSLPYVTFNYNPISPGYPSPSRNATGVNTNTTLSWHGNYNYYPVNFEVYLGTDPTALSHIGNGSLVENSTYQHQTTLSPFTQYWWRIRAISDADSVYSGLWSFTTGEYIPDPQANIAVNPTQIEMVLETYSSAMSPITIYNTGDAILEWDASISIIRNGETLLSASDPASKQDYREASRNFVVILDPSSGSIAAGDSVICNVNVDSMNSDPGLYECLFIISSNAANHPELIIPVSVELLTPATIIPDNNLRLAINEHLGHDHWHQPTITELEMMEGTFVASSKSIANLEGIQHLVNVSELYLGNNQITDISALSSLTNLTKLYIFGNQITDISAMSNLTSLSYLSIYMNEISNITPIQNLQNLRFLSLGWNNIQDFSPVSLLQNLEVLGAQQSQISDLSFVSSLSNLRELYIGGNDINDISQLSSLANLEWLDLNANQIINISPLVSLSNLMRLSLSYNNISDVSPIASLTALIDVDLDNNDISDLYPLSILPDTTNINIDNNPLSYESMLLTQTWSLPYTAYEYNATSPGYPVPSRNATSVDPNVTLSWQGNYNYYPVNFEVYLGTDPTALSYIGNGSFVENTTYQYQTTLSPLTQYWWRVKAIDGTTEIWSGLWSFTTVEDIPIPEAFISVSPSSVNISLLTDDYAEQELEIANSGTANLDWSSVINAIPRSVVVNSASPQAPRIRAEIRTRGGDISIPTAYAGRDASSFAAPDNPEIAREFTLALPEDNDRNTRAVEINLDPQSGSVMPENSMFCQISIDSSSSLSGTYQYEILISSNAVNNPLLIIPVSVTVISPLANIPDENFRMAINEYLGQDAAYLPTIEDLNGMVGTLYASGINITSIEGAQHLTNLQELYLSENQIIDISPLADLANLYYLNLGENLISYINPLAGLSNLLELSLAGNQISNINPLAGMTNLYYLHLYDNQISNISPLAGLSNLVYLALRYNQISEITPLAGMSNIYILDISSNLISDISPLTGLSNLQGLYLDNNQISDISPLANLTNLQNLYLEHNQILDINPLAGLTNLHTLELSYNQINDLSPLANLSNLQYLHLWNNRFSDISPLAGLTNLQELYFDGNPFSYESMQLSQTWSLPSIASIYNPISPGYPAPSRNATEIDPNTTLSWQGNYNYYPVNFEVYLGTDPTALSYIGNGSLVENTAYQYQTTLIPYTQYWWRIRAISDADSVYSGLWSFTTGEYIPEFAGGSGSEADPYLVETAEHLNNVRNYLNAHFLQISPIDLNGSSFLDPDGWNPIGNSSNSFRGFYNGGGLGISGLYINRPSQNYQALFGITDRAEIQNLNLYNADVYANNWSAALIGYADSTNVSNCGSDGSINGQGGSIGGLVGRMDNSELHNCYNYAHVYASGYSIGGLVGRMDNSSVYNSYSTGDVDGNGVVGGLIGYILGSSSVNNSFSTGNVIAHDNFAGAFAGEVYNSYVENSYSRGSVTAEGFSYVGGFTGEADYSTLSNCYSTGFVIGGSQHLGAFVGANTNASLLINCYWDIETSGHSTSAGGQGRLSDQMTYPYAMNTYEDWNFDTQWAADLDSEINAGYPYLQWYAAAPEFYPPRFIDAGLDLDSVRLMWYSPLAGSVDAYQIWRLRPGQELDEALWTLVSGSVMDTTSIDPQWQYLSEGTYKWAVKARYGSQFSIAEFSNEMYKEVLQAHINISPTSIYGNPTAGTVFSAELRIENQGSAPLNWQSNLYETYRGTQSSSSLSKAPALKLRQKQNGTQSRDISTEHFPTEGNIQPMMDETVYLEFYTSESYVAQSYTYNLEISSDAANNSLWTIPITIDVLPNTLVTNTAPVVSNVRVAQRDDESMMVDIYYDVYDAENDSLTISMEVSGDNGDTWNIECAYLSPISAIGSGIYSGIDKQIIWDAANEHPNELLGTNYRIRITAEDGKKDPIPANFVLVEDGTFNNGTSDVTLSSFYIDKYELTQAEYEAVMGVNPSNFTGYPNRPLEQVSWYDAIVYCNRRSVLEGLTPCYSYATFGTDTDTWPGGWNSDSNNHTNVLCNWTANGYRLPTEMEWMFAARGGNGSQGYTYSGSNTIGDVAWYQSNSINRTHDVGELATNELGTFDMSGNVFEWVWDIYGVYEVGSQENPTGDSSGDLRVALGGNWGNPEYFCQVGYRYYYYPTFSSFGIGFRIVRNLDPHRVSSPSFNPPAGEYSSMQNITISCATAGATIRYTTDGSDPSEIYGLIYESPLIMDEGTTIVKAIAYMDGYLNSEVVSAEYTITALPPDNFVFVEGGTFNNGTSDVTLSSFYIDKYELTQASYQAVMGSWNSDPFGYGSSGVGSNYPVYYVSWFDAIEYCNRRSIQEGLSPCYSYSTYGTNPNYWPTGWNTSDTNHTNVSCNWTANGYRLPTEAEWQFAARGGTQTHNYTYSGSNDINTVAWYTSNSSGTTHSVGTLAANELGIFDMSGNVYEWNWDIYGNYPSGSQNNPTGASSGSYLVSRGGGWGDYANACSVSFRGSSNATYSYYIVGFRCVRVSP